MYFAFFFFAAIAAIANALASRLKGGIGLFLGALAFCSAAVSAIWLFIILVAFVWF